MIDRYHLRYFLSVVDTGNFSRAAAACNVSQPTLSVGIAKLEAALGHPLFTRTSRRVALTEAGARLIGYARTIEQGFASAEREVARTPTASTLRLGVLATTPRRWIEDFLRADRGNAGVEIGGVEIVEGKDRELRERLARGRIDLALTILRAGDDPATTRSLRTEGYALALGSGHRLAARDRIRAEELVNEPMIVRRHCEILPETSRFFTARGVRPPFPARTTSDDRALGYVRAGLGITIMPAGFAAAGVVRVALDGFDPVREIGLVCAPHVDAPALLQGPAAAALAAAVRSPEDRTRPLAG